MFDLGGIERQLIMPLVMVMPQVQCMQLHSHSHSVPCRHGAGGWVVAEIRAGIIANINVRLVRIRIATGISTLTTLRHKSDAPGRRFHVGEQ